MICPYCGKEIADDSVFCEHCGNKVAMNAEPAPQAENQTVDMTEASPADEYADPGYAQPQQFDQSQQFEQPKKSALPKVLVGIAACVVVAVVAVFIFLPNIVLGKNAKFIKAVAKTLETGEFVSALNAEGLRSGDFTINFNGEIMEVGVDASLAADESNSKLGLSGGLTGDVKADVNFYFDKKGMKLVSDEVLGNRMFVYNFDGKNDGYIPDSLEDEGIDVEKLEEIIREGTDNSDLEGELILTTREIINSIEFKNDGKKSFEVNGKSRNCKGYKTTIDEDMMKDWVDKYEETCSKYEDAVNDALKMSGEDERYDDFFDGLKDILDDFPDVDLSLYLYKGQIAAIIVETKDEEITIEFRGGNYPSENMHVEMKGDYSKVEFDREGSFEGGIEKAKTEYSIKNSDYTESSDFYEYEYNVKSGELEFNVMAENDVDMFEFEGNLKKSGDGFVLEIKDMETDGSDVPIKGTLSVSKGAKFKEFEDKSEVCDLGKMSERELEDMAEDVRDDLYDFMNDLEEVYESYDY